MTEKENALRVFRREKPEWLPRFEKCMKGYFPKSCKRAQFSQKTRFLCQRCDGCNKMHK